MYIEFTNKSVNKNLYNFKYMVSFIFFLVLVLDVLSYVFIFKNKNLWNIPVTVFIIYVVGLYFFSTIIEIWWAPITAFLILCLIVMYSWGGKLVKQFDGSFKTEGQSSIQSKLQDSCTGGFIGGVLGFFVHLLFF